MTALRSRDGQLVTAQRQLQSLQEADATDKQSLADVIASLRGQCMAVFTALNSFVHTAKLNYLPQTSNVCINILMRCLVIHLNTADSSGTLLHHHKGLQCNRMQHVKIEWASY